MPMRRFKRISLIVAAATCLSLVGTLSAAANFGAPANPCKQFKKNSKAWKECKGQVKLDEHSSAEEQFAKGYWLAKTGDYAKALKVLKALPNQNDTGVLTMIGYLVRLATIRCWGMVATMCLSAVRALTR